MKAKLLRTGDARLGGEPREARVQLLAGGASPGDGSRGLGGYETSRIGESSRSLAVAGDIMQERMAVQQRLADRLQLLAGPLGLVAEPLEGRTLVDPVALHQNPLRALDDGAPGEGPLELLGLPEAPHRDIERAPQGVCVEGVDVREDARQRRAGDELRLCPLHDRNDGADALADDLLDHRERVRGVVIVQPDHSHVRKHLACAVGDGGDVDLARDDRLPDLLGHSRDHLEADRILVGDEKPQLSEVGRRAVPLTAGAHTCARSGSTCRRDEPGTDDNPTRRTLQMLYDVSWLPASDLDAAPPSGLSPRSCLENLS